MTTQVQLDFEPGLTERFRSLKECVAAAVYGSRIGLAGVAAACDLSPSALSRMLNENPDDPRHLPLDLLPKIVRATSDNRPVYYLVEMFLESADAKRSRSLERLATLADELPELLRQAGVKRGRGT